jgi:phosphoribosyl 1,2-cyclic phosphodiesterase
MVLSSPPFSPPQEHGLRAAVLGSGSGGNSLILESSSDRILLDAGFSCRELERRLRSVGVEPETLRAIVLTHEHRDHCRGAELLSRRWDLPIYGTRGTLEGCRFAQPRALRLVPFAIGLPFSVSGFRLEAFAVPHDAREPVGLVVEDGCNRRLGLITDLGSFPERLDRTLGRLSVLVQETNHDLDMLRSGPYPWALKKRVAGDKGHLSNDQAASGLARVLCDELQFVVLYHLSRTNNRPTLAEASIGEELHRNGSEARLLVAHQTEPSTWLEVMR